METPGDLVPQPLRDKVIALGPAVTPSDVDTYRKLQEVQDKSQKLQTILTAWEGQNREERAMRRYYARWLLIGLFSQVFLVNVAFFALGFGWLKVDQWVAQSFILAVFAEIASMSFFIVKYLFPKVSADVLATLEKL